MSRDTDLVDLIQTANQIYLIDPNHHIRSAFIQVDDLCELIMKSWLQIDSHTRQKNCLISLENRGIVTSQNQKRLFHEHCEHFFSLSHLEDALGIISGNSQQILLNSIINNHFPLNTYQLRQQCLNDLTNNHLISGRKQQRNFEHFCDFSTSQANFERALNITVGSTTYIDLHNELNKYQPLATWTPTKEQGFKSFVDIVIEIKERHKLPKDQILFDTLDRIQERRDNRNNFFHNQNQTGLTVNDEQCLRAFCDLYALMDCLFPGAIASNATPVMNAQIGAIKARRNMIHDAAKEKTYNKILSTWENLEVNRKLKVRGEVLIQFPNRAYEYCVIHYYSQSFYDALTQAGLMV